MKRLLMLLVLASCSPSSAAPASSDGGASTCPDAPSSCPQPAPAYAGDVDAIFAARCTVCHAPGGEQPQTPLTSYAEIFPRRGKVLSQVASCAMPKDGHPMPDAERVRMLGWLVCGAPP
jgi:cytochrome c553